MSMAYPEVEDLGVACAICRDGYIPQALCSHCGQRHCPACERCQEEREAQAAWLRALHGPNPPELAGQIMGRVECEYGREVNTDHCAGAMQPCGNCAAHCRCGEGDVPSDEPGDRFEED